MIDFFSRVKIYSPLIIVAACFVERPLSGICASLFDFETAMLPYTNLMLICLCVWCVFLLFCRFGLYDVPLAGLLFLAVVAYHAAPILAWKEPEVITLLSGVIVGKGARLLLKNDTWEDYKVSVPIINSKVVVKQTQEILFLQALVGLLLFSSFWQLRLSNTYRGPRWMGLWDNPNIYGMLMGAGVVLAAGILANGIWKLEYGRKGIQRSECADSRSRLVGFFSAKSSWFLGIAVFMMGVGLVMSYSRGAWLATGIGLVYLTWCYGKLKWRYVLPVIIIVGLAALHLWGSTPDSAPWYAKRADLGRPSAQNRATAWRAGLEIMRDHPFGVGWNNSVRVYGEKYHPPEGGPAALATNDYLMIGSELGVVALLCFVYYAALCLHGKCDIHSEKGRSQACCRAGAIVFFVAFWFDGALFELPTAAVFWILLELGSRSFESAGDMVAPNHR